MSEATDTTTEVPRQSGPGEQRDKRVVGRYGRIGNLGVFRHHLEPLPPSGTMLVLRTERGTELGRTLIHVGPGPRPGFIGEAALDSYLQANGADYPFSRGGRVLRLANPQDLNDQQHLDRAGLEKGAFCNDQIKQLGLKMKLVAVEHILGGERIVFYFTAEHRVDFRELVRRLASQYHTRIEMRQVGARDEARLVADFERCGMQCCCQTYLKFLKPVSMRMAKTQKATLDPTKISGRCGRLMCCLRYEDATYEELLGALPRKGKWVRTADGVVGKVVEAQILTQLVRLVLPDKTHTVVPNESIVERDVPEPPVAPPEPVRPPPARKERIRLADAVRMAPPTDTAPPPEGAPSAPGVGAAPQGRPPRGPRPEAGADKPAAPSKRRRRRRRKKAHPESLSAAPSLGAQPAQPKPAQSGPARPKGRKGRRRRRKKPGKGPPSPPPTP